MPAAEAAAFAAAGRDLLRVDRFAEAAAAFEKALAGAGGAVERAEIAAALAESRFECGRFDGSAAMLHDALAALPPGDTPAAQRARAAIELGLARAAVRERRLDEARALLEAALARFEATASPLLAARIEGLLGGVLAIRGDLAPALERFHGARARFAVPPLTGHVRDAARLAMNIAIASSEFGRHADAEREIGVALDLFDGLVRAGRREALPELARARRNHGYILAGMQRHAAAVETLRAGVAAYERAARTSGAARDGALWRASHAGTLNSLGFSLFALGELDAADAVLRDALRAFRRVVREQPAQRDEQARAVVNRAHVAAARGELAAAARGYRQGWRVFEALVAEGRRHHDTDAANAAFGVARIALRQGRVPAAVRAFEAALDTCAAATQQGRLQHAQAWLGGWQRQFATWLEAVADDGVPRTAQAASLRRVLARPPLRPAGSGPEPLHALAAALRPLAQAPAAVPAALEGAFEDVAAAYLEHLFAWSATLLAESDPVWLRAQAAAVAACVAALGDAAAARRDAAALLAAWFFGTRGLRAQRSALAEGGDPRLAELHALLQRLHAIEAEMLGEGPVADAGGDGGRTLALPAWAPAPSPYGERRGAEWRALRMRLEPLRRPLLAEGLLPDLPRLDVRRAAATLGADEALLLVARSAPDRVRVVMLHAPDAQGGCALHHEARLDPALAAFPCGVLHRLARAALCAAARGQPVRAAAGDADPDGAADGDGFALDMFARLWQAAVGALLPALQRRGLHRLALVPADDLHVVPWNHLADGARPGAPPLRVYPNCGAWWRRPRARSGPAPRRWVVAASEGSAVRPLPWAGVERQLSARLWGRPMRPLRWGPDGRPRASGADALLGIGHGGTPDGNPARAGLALGSTVLSSQDLPRLPDCRHALLSACLLGHTEDAQGEGLGFLSACLDYRMQFAAGWLTEVPDFAACLYSLAVQWALRGAAGTPWSEVLHGVRRALAAGRWPPGFGAWLAREGAALSAPLGDAASGPPALLQRALPWAVALGD